MKQETTLSISGIHCGSCSKLISLSVKDLPGVESITWVGDTTLQVTYESSSIDEAKIKEAIITSGYQIA